MPLNIYWQQSHTELSHDKKIYRGEFNHYGNWEYTYWIVGRGGQEQGLGNFCLFHSGNLELLLTKGCGKSQIGQKSSGNNYLVAVAFIDVL